MIPVLVVIPCRDEAGDIVSVIRGFRAALPRARILVADNASTDGSGELAAGAGAEVLAVSDGGKGCAVRAGLAAAREFEIVLLADGDGAFDPEDAPRILAPIEAKEADIVIGSRFPFGEDIPFPRRIANGAINALVRRLFGTAQTDLLSGFRALSPAARRSLALEACGFEIEMEMSLAALCGGLRVVEAPVAVRWRTRGTSKVRLWRDGLRLVRFAFARRFFRKGIE